MNELRVFNNAEFGEVRTIVIDGEPWFVGNDVAKALAYKDLYSAMRHNVDEDDKRLCPISSTNGVQQTTVINESGLYSLIFGSRLEKAREFKRWVTHEVLPSLRQNGTYTIPKKQDSYMIEDPVERAERWIEEQKEHKLEVDRLNVEVAQLRPKALMHDKLLDASLLVNFRDAAKEIGISQSQFTGWLKENGYVYANSAGELRPMEQYMESDFFQMKPYQNPYSGYKGSRTYITGRGLAAFKILLDTSGYNRDTMKKHGGRNKRNMGI